MLYVKIDWMCVYKTCVRRKTISGRSEHLVYAQQSMFVQVFHLTLQNFFAHVLFFCELEISLEVFNTLKWNHGGSTRRI